MHRRRVMRRPCGSIKASFTLDFVLRRDFVIGAERDHVGALFCVVGNAAPVERGQAVGVLGEELTMDFKLGSKSVNPWPLFQTSGGLFWQEKG